jgi:glutaminase
MTDIYNETIQNTEGKVADYIPQLANINPELYGISICSVNGDFSILEIQTSLSLYNIVQNH